MRRRRNSDSDLRAAERRMLAEPDDVSAMVRYERATARAGAPRYWLVRIVTSEERSDGRIHPEEYAPAPLSGVTVHVGDGDGITLESRPAIAYPLMHVGMIFSMLRRSVADENSHVSMHSAKAWLLDGQSGDVIQLEPDGSGASWPFKKVIYTDEAHGEFAAGKWIDPSTSQGDSSFTIGGPLATPYCQRCYYTIMSARPHSSDILLVAPSTFVKTTCSACGRPVALPPKESGAGRRIPRRQTNGRRR